MQAQNRPELIKKRIERLAKKYGLHPKMIKTQPELRIEKNLTSMSRNVKNYKIFLSCDDQLSVYDRFKSIIRGENNEVIPEICFLGNSKISVFEWILIIPRIPLPNLPESYLTEIITDADKRGVFPLKQNEVYLRIAPRSSIILSPSTKGTIYGANLVIDLYILPKDGKVMSLEIVLKPQSETSYFQRIKPSRSLNQP